eukprot:TRINITY_DN2084_c0_g1_i1.p1 TRINITY_DN2084_c0_g1~~TRINITY_DN2084_c0_g1_i1.p1  ORF type:complete len:239 (+),score=19.62 TRINITY_DN2084_c0_g1_i1:401-1117(+)
MDIGAGSFSTSTGEPRQVHLYWYPVSPTARAAAIVLNMLSTTKITPVFHIVDLFKGEQHRERFKKISPKGQVPTLVEPDGFTLIESLAIARYLANQYQDEDNPIYPRDPKQRALVEQGLEIFRSNLIVNTGIVVYHEFIAPKIGQIGNQDIAQKARAELASTLSFIEDFFFKTCLEYLIGTHFTLVDTTFAVYLRHLEFVNYDISPYPKIRYFYARIKTTDFFKKTHYPLEAMGLGSR